jgi:sulfate transport system substrate-binding protein
MRKLIIAAAMAFGFPAGAIAQPNDILNVSYDIARELYVGINNGFLPYWKAKNGQAVEVKQSHGGSTRQARAILEGLAADVVTFNQVTDIDILVKGGLVQPGWQKKFPNNASPFYSLPAFLVRAGNPKNIKDWADLARADVQPILPNPKTAGNARYTYLAAYAWAKSTYGSDEKAIEYMKKWFANVPVFDTGARASTTTFAERNIGDVLLTFEAEVNAVRREYGEGKFQIVLPSQSLLAEFPVAVVDKIADQRKTRPLATGYLEYLFTPEGQEIGAKNFHRVVDKDVAAKYAAQFPPIKLVTVEEAFGGWEKAGNDHFKEGGILDKVFVQR